MRTLCWAAALVAIGAGPAVAGDAAHGAELARSWCVECHVVAPGEAGGTAGPGFAEVANRAGAEPETIRAWLADPHPPMPNMSLSMAQIDDLGAYVMSFRQ